MIDDWNTPQTPVVNSVRTEIVTAEPRTSIVISGDDGAPLVTLHFDGRVEFGPHYNPTEAARRFWSTIVVQAPHCKENAP